ncbi:tRNA dihydrouridine synthase DusB [Thioalkalivibrio denitrificans]|uniref:tRNA-dihydrouridine synthase B n=1 Tax=Thioalkalivibrio denitrificans TaxID=108003 RepID=A0A1V3NEH3_9GAMM|nr:tRNA dihydrouridine synthase DusB [Thioalkalivibrio denitrificans]OOG23196.1 tRNA dihydrouridine synthase DusB [Thioalkalivibrio denitrificans]
MLRIGDHILPNGLILAPMAGVTDRPFRLLCRRLGADMAVSEMVTANTDLWHTPKSRRRMDHAGEPAPVSVQIAGAEPLMLAEAARRNADNGAQIIDINMGCPARKVCNRAAGSALLGDERLVGHILEAVVAAVDVPVTLKIRLGLDRAHMNALSVARIAEQSGVQALAVHGRTRACRFRGAVDYDAIAAVKRRVTLPVIANGDVSTPEQARVVLEHTGADGLMIGRAAQGRPWIFRDIQCYLETGRVPDAPDADALWTLLREHLEGLYSLYGEATGVRVARKHIGWYLQAHAAHGTCRAGIMAAEDTRTQLARVFECLQRHHSEVMAA